MQLLLLATHTLQRKLCEYCLEPTHFVNKCTSTNDDLGCACGSGVNLFICCKTDDCKSRSNWPKVQGNATSLTRVTSNAAVVNSARIGSTLLPIISVKIQGSEAPLRVLWDNCSQSTFIRISVAEKLKLPGYPISFILICSDGTEKKKTGMKYKITLVDKENKKHEIEAIGLEQISNTYCSVKIIKPVVVPDGQIKKFLGNCHLERSGGLVDILAGSDIARLHPVAVSTVDNLVVMKSMFGWTMMGYNSDYVKVEDTKNLFRVNNCQVRSVERTTIEVGKALFTKPMNKFSSNHRYFRSKMRKEQKKVLIFTRGYFSTSSVKARLLLMTLSRRIPIPGKSPPDPV